MLIILGLSNLLTSGNDYNQLGTFTWDSNYGNGVYTNWLTNLTADEINPRNFNSSSVIIVRKEYNYKWINIEADKYVYDIICETKFSSIVLTKDNSRKNCRESCCSNFN